MRRGRGEARRGRGAGEAQPGPDRSHRAAAAALFPPRVACPPLFLLPRCGGCCTIWSRVSTRQGAGPQAAWFWGLWDQNPLGVRFVGALPFPLCREVGKLETSCSGTMPDLRGQTPDTRFKRYYKNSGCTGLIPLMDFRSFTTFLRNANRKEAQLGLRSVNSSSILLSSEEVSLLQEKGRELSHPSFIRGMLYVV